MRLTSPPVRNFLMRTLETSCTLPQQWGFFPILAGSLRTASSSCWSFACPNGKIHSYRDNSIFSGFSTFLADECQTNSFFLSFYLTKTQKSGVRGPSRQNFHVRFRFLPGFFYEKSFSFHHRNHQPYLSKRWFLTFSETASRSPDFIYFGRQKQIYPNLCNSSIFFVALGI